MASPPALGFTMGLTGWVSPVPLPMQEMEEVDAAKEEDPRHPKDTGQVSPQHGSWSRGRESCV